MYCGLTGQRGGCEDAVADLENKLETGEDVELPLDELLDKHAVRSPGEYWRGRQASSPGTLC